MRYVFMCLTGFLLMSAGVGQTTASHKSSAVVSATGDSVLTQTANGKPIRIVVSTNKIDIGTASQERQPPQAQKTNCTYSRFPCSQVANVSIWVGNKRLFVPRSVFADLTDVGTMELSVKGETIILTFIGGDASESYTIKIYFDGHRVTKRERYANEARSLVETTTYSPPAVLD